MRKEEKRTIVENWLEENKKSWTWSGLSEEEQNWFIGFVYVNIDKLYGNKKQVETTLCIYYNLYVKRGVKA